MIVRVGAVLRRTVCGEIVNVTINSPSQDYTHLDDHTSPTYDMTLGFKPFTEHGYLFDFVIEAIWHFEQSQNLGVESKRWSVVLLTR